MKARLQILFIALMVSGCIGTDYLSDPIIGERIEISPLQTALMPGDMVQLTAVYFDEFGQENEVVVVWTSSAPQVASVDENGLVTAAGAGTAMITASFQTAVSESSNITVVTDENDVASVEVTSPKVALDVNEKVTLAVLVKNINGSTFDDRLIEWFSENSSIVTVSDVGEVTAIAPGLAGVHAKSEGVKSNSVEFVVGSARSGLFVPAGGYSAEGTAMLKLDNGKVVLELSNNFRTSFALGTFIYLSNSTSGSATFSNGLEVAQIFNNGAKTFDVSAISPGVGLFDYLYVIILCKPARLTFGYADLNN